MDLTKTKTMTLLEKSVISMIGKATPLVVEATKNLLVDPTTKDMVAMAECQQRWVDAILADAPFPEIMPDENTSRMVFERIALITNIVHSGAYKMTLKANGNQELIDKYDIISRLTEFQFKWIDAYRYNLPLPGEV